MLTKIDRVESSVRNWLRVWQDYVIKESELFGNKKSKKSKKVSKTGRQETEITGRKKGAKRKKMSAVERARSKKSKQPKKRKTVTFQEKVDDLKEIQESDPEPEDNDSEIEDFIEPDEKELEKEKEEFEKNISKSFPKTINTKNGYNKPYKILTIMDKFVDEIRR